MYYRVHIESVCIQCIQSLYVRIDILVHMCTLVYAQRDVLTLYMCIQCIQSLYVRIDIQCIYALQYMHREMCLLSICVYQSAYRVSICAQIYSICVYQSAYREHMHIRNREDIFHKHQIYIVREYIVRAYDKTYSMELECIEGIQGIYREYRAYIEQRRENQKRVVRVLYVRIRLVGSLKSQISFAKEPYKTVNILHNTVQHSIFCALFALWKLQVSFAKEPYKTVDILQMRPIVSRSPLIVATPYVRVLYVHILACTYRMYSTYFSI